MLSILELLLDQAPLIFELSPQRGVSCPKCRYRLKYVVRGEHEDKVQCVMCERVWLRSKGRWLGSTLRPAENSKSEVRSR